ncbi:hypothetical protein BVC80_1523g2 [Macleaya cordata]|uniref:Uncharacterized protein n=1 Tax=Macleaya cordata TaxID=56857 RepID=A0A200PMW2_MACCD|nr:hypothetical protein BVC80_1523g2 [Macleaya cordata]
MLLFYFPAANEYEGKSRVTKLASGDDLDDDFMVEDMNNGNKNTSSGSDANSVSLGVQIEKNIVVKPKKQGPKVVNFLG